MKHKLLLPAIAAICMLFTAPQLQAAELNNTDQSNIAAPTDVFGDDGASTADQTNPTADTPENISGTNEYSFETDDNIPISVVLRFVTDEDGDGVNDVPDITLTSPDGTALPITTASLELTNNDSTFYITWQKNFVQIDIANPEDDDWKITTSIPVSFKTMDYAGKAQDVTSEEESNPEPKESAPAISSTSIMLLGVIVAVIIVMLVLLFKKPKEKDTSRKPDDERLLPKSDEDEIEEIRRELEKMHFSDDDDDYNPAQVSSPKSASSDKYKPVTVTQEDIDNDDTIEEITEEKKQPDVVIEKKPVEKPVVKEEPKTKKSFYTNNRWD